MSTGTQWSFSRVRRAQRRIRFVARVVLTIAAAGTAAMVGIALAWVLLGRP